MTYQAIYRRFRPKTFEDVLGQEHITITLKNQILSNNIAHAYLFSGTRGTGKTSTAKIFARAVNCLDSKDGNPCNECEVCRGILEDSIMDVVEMDAASNNSVEDIRELREKVKYPPSKGRFKVYIIDEVHMLSKGAFNALLKTLEEPPKHLLFILATTEPQKIPATILSRCQRYDFKRISTKDIVKNMDDICSKLAIEVEEKSLDLIARNSDGAMRDALSILDQCISFAQGKITYDYVLSILGTVNNEFLFELSEYIIDRNIDHTLRIIDEIVQRGKDVNQFIKDLIMHFRNLMIARSTHNLQEILDSSDEVIEALKKQAARVDISDIIRYINILSEAETQSKWVSQPRIILEVSIIKALNPAADVDIEGLNQRVSQIERALQGEGTITRTKPQKPPVERSEKSKEEKKVSKPSEEIQEKSKKEVTKEEASSYVTASEDKKMSLKQVQNAWGDVLNRIKGDRISIHALLIEGTLKALRGNILDIAFEDGFGFHKEAVEKKENKEYIEGVVNSYLETKVRINCIMASEMEDDRVEEDSNEDLIEKVKDIFGKDIVEVK